MTVFWFANAIISQTVSMLPFNPAFKGRVSSYSAFRSWNLNPLFFRIFMTLCWGSERSLAMQNTF